MVVPNPVAPDPVNAAHVPVLLNEVLESLEIHPGARLIDGTLGGGGHTEAMLNAAAPDGQVLGIDADPAALSRVQIRLASAIASGRLTIAHSHFGQLSEVAIAHHFTDVDAILLDLGVSSFQLETAARGFSFTHDGPLDMRFDPTQGSSAAEIVNTWREQDIADLIFQYGEERQSYKIARYLVNHRPFTTTAQLAQAIEQAVGGRRGHRLHPATQTFQALRIAVNQELTELTTVLPQCLALLKPGGRLAIISFHSLEDRIVKQWLQQEARTYVTDRTTLYGGYERTSTLEIITRKPIIASAAEIQRNPRSRSAKLRVAQKI